MIPHPELSPKTKPQIVTVVEAATDEAEKQILDVFGFDILRELQGKTWDERGQAVQAVRARVAQGNMQGVPLEDFFRASCRVARLALKDKVMPVFFDGLDLAKLLLGDFAAKHEVDKQLVSAELDIILPIIVAKTSDRNARSIEGTRQAIVYLARQPTLGCQPVMAHILALITNAKEVAAIRGRLELIAHIIDEFGFNKNSGMSLSAVMGFVRPHLDASDEKVRRAAIEVTVSCYSLKGERTLKYCTNLKPALLKLLEQRFAEVDATKGGGKGKPLSSPAHGLPEVRGAKIKKARASNDSSRQSSSSSVKRLDRIPAPSQQGAILEDEPYQLHADLFGNGNDPLSPVLSTFASPERAGPPPSQFGMAIDPVGISTLATPEDPNYIPSPTVATEDPFLAKNADLDEAFMDEIEGF